MEERRCDGCGGLPTERDRADRVGRLSDGSHLVLFRGGWYCSECLMKIDEDNSCNHRFFSCALGDIEFKNENYVQFSVKDKAKINRFMRKNKILKMEFVRY